MGRNILRAHVWCLLLCLVAHVICSSSYGPHIEHIELRDRILTITCSYPVDDTEFKLVAMPPGKRTNSVLNWMGYEKAVKKLELVEYPDVTFVPLPADPVATVSQANVGSVEVPVKHTMLLLHYEYGQDPSSIAQVIDITELWEKYLSSPDHSAELKFSHGGGTGEIALGLLAMVFLALLFVFAIVWLIVVMSRKQQKAS